MRPNCFVLTLLRVHACFVPLIRHLFFLRLLVRSDTLTRNHIHLQKPRVNTSKVTAKCLPVPSNQTVNLPLLR